MNAGTLLNWVDASYVFLAAILVISMQMGFALLEAGSTRMKNAGHIAGKQIISFAIAGLFFWFAGFAVTFGEGNGFIGWSGWMLQTGAKGEDKVFASLSWADIPLALKFLFQMAFAAVSLAIAWGGFAERAKFSVYLVFGILFTTIIYPVIGHWVWGGGWLSEMGMQDFAGSTVVHLQGALAALVATLLLGPRIGKYTKDGKPNLLPGHNQVYSVLGVIILWIGWFGFNAGSTMSVKDGFFGYIALTTNLATAAGAIAAMLIARAVLGKADIPSMLNGVLAALVAITAACAFVEPWAAVIIGAIASVLTFFTSLYFERKGVDDPVFAFSVHGVAGIWGTLSTGFFASPRLVEYTGIGQAGLFYGGSFHQFYVQIIGVLGAAVYVALISFIILYALKATIGLRVTPEEEIVGLDLSEHGAYGYPEHLESAEKPAYIAEINPKTLSRTLDMRLQQRAE
ncbi:MULTISPECIES: ammonium transporter [Aneurinibacillus]|uniref:Ammonium transporter n=1 Tax=Aneurinibacillus thermoaerophilus TaxID=143495 RepID=A0A1G7YP10_ANETH|nr:MULTISPECIES: ammonium transporter [Aneurinibacillus]AMA73782.1 ammonium transporter [Aneurinibacillus sp. XH2]MED0679401.1 ammonium transporter [Aneurinibacillus thermoaerophilus]MED0738028.1 ammonium transporter [Aneurinibacillus thermoaerophilus]MED0756449.1 ammonium transporter [Aneurinibacillus thermoaerophilus]MED0761152.1 ammonium transporter [Aneurinibacillus thermoaerophilus]